MNNPVYKIADDRKSILIPVKLEVGDCIAFSTYGHTKESTGIIKGFESRIDKRQYARFEPPVNIEVDHLVTEDHTGLKHLLRLNPRDEVDIITGEDPDWNTLRIIECQTGGRRKKRRGTKKARRTRRRRSSRRN